jgi:preprotein translocase subunit SecA
VEAITARWATLADVRDGELARVADELRQRARSDGDPDDLLVEVFAVAAEGATRRLGLRPFHVQLEGAVGLHQGNVVEMPTGEGKTLVAVFPATLHALGGRGVHVLTSNDYLAARDAAWMAPVFELFGLTVGAVGHASGFEERRRAHAADVTYAAANEVGFDHLRDNLVLDPGERVLRPLHQAILDEADSLLVDEGRIPLVIAGRDVSPAGDARLVDGLVRRLRLLDHVTSDREERNLELTTEGMELVERELGVDLSDPRQAPLRARIHVALKAHVALRRDVDYLVRDGAIALIDGFKGRVIDRRRWPDGIHAALEAKEGLAESPEGRVLGSVTMRSFVAMYPRVCGMTATARQAAVELLVAHGMGVLALPPHVPSVRIDRPDAIHATRDAKHAAIVSMIGRLHARGRPVLVGTGSVAESEALAARLSSAHLPCRVLNARHHFEEAAVIAEAGDAGAVTVSTNMAGRGVDIRLGGKDGRHADVVRKLGGLMVIGACRHESRRIDDQLRGRAGRQGDPGETRFVLSLEDELMARYGVAEAVMAGRDTHADGELGGPALSAEVERAQRVIEGQNDDIRAMLWRYDEVLERQRLAFLARRERVLVGADRGQLDDAAEARRRELMEELGEDVVAEALRFTRLRLLDVAWCDHLAWVADLREGLTLQSLGGADPWIWFNRETFLAFSRLIAESEARASEVFRRAVITRDGVDLAREGLERPAATWTYLTTDMPYGTLLERFLSGLGRRMPSVLGA